MKLSDFVVPDAIITDLVVPNKEGAIRALVGSLKACGIIAADSEDSIVAAIMKREELGSTGIGNGVAVPHTKHPSVTKLVAAIALTNGGVDFASLDGNSVHAVVPVPDPALRVSTMPSRWPRPRLPWRSSTRAGKHITPLAQPEFLQFFEAG